MTFEEEWDSSQKNPRKTAYKLHRNEGEPLVLVENPKPGINVLVLNRPDKRNALSTGLMESLCANIEQLNQADSATRVMKAPFPGTPS